MERMSFVYEHRVDSRDSLERAEGSQSDPDTLERGDESESSRDTLERAEGTESDPDTLERGDDMSFDEEEDDDDEVVSQTRFDKLSEFPFPSEKLSHVDDVVATDVPVATAIPNNNYLTPFFAMSCPDTKPLEERFKAIFGAMPSVPNYGPCKKCYWSRVNNVDGLCMACA